MASFTCHVFGGTKGFGLNALLARGSESGKPTGSRTQALPIQVSDLPRKYDCEHLTRRLPPNDCWPKPRLNMQPQAQTMCKNTYCLTLR